MLRQLMVLTLLGTPVLVSAKATPTTKSEQKIKIKEVKFIGVKNVPVEELKAVLVNKKSSLFGLMSLNGKYNAKELKNDPLRIRDVYYQHGYLDVQVSQPKLTVNHATSEATITYRIREGLPYKASSVRIQKRRGVDTASLSRKLSMHSGDRFNVQKLREDIRAISSELGNAGYPFVQVQPRFRKDPRRRTIQVVYFIKPGRKGVIGTINIHGNTKTKDSVIRSYIALAPGDRYRLDDLTRTQDELMRTGFFDSVIVRPVPGKNGRVNLDVAVKEGKTGSIMGAAGYDSMEGIFLEGSFSEKNIFGSGVTVGLSASYSKLKKNGTLSFDDPRVAGTMFGLYGGLFYTTTDDDDGATYGFDKVEKGGYLGLRRRINSVLNASIDYNYNDVRYRNINAAKHPGGLQNYVKSSVGVSLTFNNTDSYYTPRRGIYAKARVEYAGLGSGKDLAKYLKGSLKFAAYYGLRDLTGYDLIARYKMQANYIHDLGFVPEAERLHIGGYYNGVRGYRSASIQPGQSGGLKSLVNSLELSMSLSEKNKVRLTGFVDYGMIGNTKFNEVVKKSVGAQIEWRSPMGDVNFVFAKAIRPKSTDRTSTFEFTIGKEF